MKTAEDAVLFFRTRGYQAIAWSKQPSSVLVVDPWLASGALSPFVLDFEDQGGILLHSSDDALFNFDSLADAVNALLPKLGKRLADHPE